MEENGEEVDMCYIAQGLINEGIEKGIEALVTEEQVRIYFEGDK